MCYDFSVDARGERVGKNEVLFRQVNERLKEIGEGFSLVSESADFVCECGSASCAAPIRMTLAEYEQVRSDPELFFVLPSHRAADVEAVVESREGYDVVRKHKGEPARMARETDPRS
ncbi:MAG TPA: hypothetical protein VGQ84_09825 [Gaiellaceae bacterium]|jgi:hypothetical protein|nr:hypothetical protein [Gaiellaceae bacterium]